jgi:peroxiredoxin
MMPALPVVFVSMVLLASAAGADPSPAPSASAGSACSLTTHGSASPTPPLPPPAPPGPGASHAGQVSKVDYRREIAPPVAAPEEDIEEKLLISKIEEMMEPAPANQMEIRLQGVESLCKSYLTRYPTGRGVGRYANQLSMMLKRADRLDDLAAFAASRLEEGTSPADEGLATRLLIQIASWSKSAEKSLKVLDAAPPREAGTVLGAQRAISRGEVLLAAGQLDEAIAALEKAPLPESAEMAVTRRAALLANAYRTKAQSATGAAADDARRKALAMLTVLMESARKRPANGAGWAGAFLAAADLSRRLGDGDAGLKYYKEVQTLFPRSAEAAEARAMGTGLALVGKPAPDFSLPGLDGQPVSLEDHAGKVVLVHFWQMGSAASEADIRQLAALGKQLSGRPFVVISVNLDGEPRKAEVQVYAQQAGMGWPQLQNNSGTSTLASLYGVRMAPWACVIDAKGVLKYAGLRGSDLDAAVTSEVDAVAKAGK